MSETLDPADDLDAGGAHPLFRRSPSSVEFGKLRKRLVRQTRQALDDFAMVRPGDRWLVCLSGGKDSYALLAVLLDLKWRGLLPVDLLACNLDQAQPGFPADVLPDFLEGIGMPYRIERQDTYSVVMSKVPTGKTYCALCSRLRRGHLYRVAREEGCQAVVLGHHREDILETFFLNLFHGGKLATMPPKLVNEEGDLFVLRPLAYAAEDDIARFSAAMEFPIIPCDLCGSQEGLQRNQIKAMLADWEKKSPGRKETMLRALGSGNPSHLLDRTMFDFAGLNLRT
ncbi:tRNA 2-thiocytidine(32) synthetase TtcA [Kaistia algarum]|uniref:tRNA 2-thiocytidine(32) synthetase TtcA n=1 Tax=Kaistia algarum TaxID=2083279 RepID=UPI000CE8CD18|nr:tRNA 2-thiocytidine(32) synthetase TtcA [Kaistia algarum]MCX5516064.1 tRNA 2-thiocytidine(32) synthetase TtcA [Kaistia algarum]PPE77989.1 tRNA 2-thiocytidine(32) synthetase TtcA [Kaistia algarum]